MSDLYSIFTLTNKCTAAQLKSEYKRLVQKNHPDKYKSEQAKQNAELRFKKIKAAYDILSDPQQRERYDMTGRVDDKKDIDHQSLDLLMDSIESVMLQNDFQLMDYISATRAILLLSIETSEQEVEKFESKIKDIELLKTYIQGDLLIEYLNTRTDELASNANTGKDAIEIMKTAISLIEKEGFEYTGPTKVPAPWERNENTAAMAYD